MQNRGLRKSQLFKFQTVLNNNIPERVERVLHLYAYKSSMKANIQLNISRNYPDSSRTIRIPSKQIYSYLGTNIKV